MAAREAAIEKARAGLFLLFARLVADGLDPVLTRELAALPELADLIDPGRDPDQEAADHQDLFGFRVPPYAGVFLDGEGRIGGKPGDDALRAYVAAGMDRIRDDLGPDHLATQLEFLAYCSERGLDTDARTFLDGQVLNWLPGLVAAVLREPFPAYRGLLPVVEEAAAEYRVFVDQPVDSVDAASEQDDLLARPETGVREIASFLGTPARSGFWLGRGDVERIGRETGVPRGFGGRLLMLTNLLRGAAEYDRIDVVISAIDRIAVDTADHWKRAAGPWTDRWMHRIDRTRLMLAEMEQRIRRAGDQSSDF